ncbi:MAG: hypothetical protein B7X33_04135 [Lysobacterales bacterium 13-68-4]|nr:MAG: hypothetical protein B7X33_04135 [Xanthomonadales bacterium 13-68-4]
MQKRIVLFLCGALALGAVRAAPSTPSKALQGAWTLVRVDNVYPDGHRVELYGPHPQGRWLIDAQGHYMMQIVRARRMPFASGDKSRGTPEEYRAASRTSTRTTAR